MPDPVPPEIVDKIVDELWNDRRALRSSSLVSREWAPRARYHLFRRIRISPSPCHEGLLQHLEEDADFGRLVQHVTLSGRLHLPSPRPARMLYRKPGAEYTLNWINNTLSAVEPETFLNVVELELEALPLRDDVVATIARVFPDVHTLALSVCQDGTPAGGFPEFLQSFSKLRTLRLRKCAEPIWRYPREGSVRKAAEQPKIASLDVSTSWDLGPLVKWLLSADAYTHLRTLSFPLEDERTTVPMASLLHACGDKLEHLRIYPPSNDNPTEQSREAGAPFDLTPCTGLRSLTFLCPAATPKTKSGTPPSSWFVPMLPTMRSTRLAEIRILVDAATLDRDGPLPLEEWDAALVQHCGGVVQRVIVGVLYDARSFRGDRGEVERVVWARLSTLRERKVLRLGGYYGTAWEAIASDGALFAACRTL